MLEQLYNEFTTQVLPKLQEGLTITKDYFTDLFGRYVHYLLIMDTIKASIGLLFLIIGVVLIIVTIKKYKSEDWGEDTIIPIVLVVIAPLILAGILMLYLGVNNIMKDLYVPEIRILEILKYKELI